VIHVVEPDANDFANARERRAESLERTVEHGKFLRFERRRHTTETIRQERTVDVVSKWAQVAPRSVTTVDDGNLSSSIAETSESHHVANPVDPDVAL
jgi:hypothetical protein